MRGRRSLRTLLAMGVLVALVALALSACGGGGSQEANKKKKRAGGGSDVTNGQIAFRRYFDPDQTEGALFTMNPDGSHVRQITYPPKDWPHHDDPAWSPDGERIAFTRQTSDEGARRIMVVNPDAGDAREVTPCTGRCVANFDPAFSPDGDSIAFSRQVGPPSLKGEPRPLKSFSWPESKNYWAIFIVGIDGSNPHQVTNIDPKLPANCCVSDSGPAFSPDGEKLAFVRVRYPEENYAVFVQPIDSPEDARQVTPWDLNCQERPEFSPDGKLMLFRCLPEGEEGPSNLYWVHPDGTAGLHQLTHEDADKQYLGSSFSPSFSEGEGWITVGRTAGYGDEGNADVFRVLIEDGEVVREVNLTKSGEWESNPNWGSHQAVG